MNLDVVLLSRIQFALTIGFHFLFPPISIGLAWLLVIAETVNWRRRDEDYGRIGKFFARLLGLTFAVGVATGIVMEFQFGMNWAKYSTFVGDIFGAPLAAEGVFAFFLESGFLGLYLFGRNRVSRGVHWFSALMVALGATLSAFWILVANSWQQTPAGYVIRNGRAELTSFREAVFNPSTFPRFFHTLDACLISGAFFMAGIAAFMLLRNRDDGVAGKSMKLAVTVGLVASVLELFPFGHMQIVQVANTQPAKFAASEGIYTTRPRTPLVLFGIPADNPPHLRAPVVIPGVVSILLHGDIDAPVTGLDKFPEDEIPPLYLPFVSYHTMIGLGMYFIALMALAAFLLYRKKLRTNRPALTLLLWSTPLPMIACELGWIVAEVGRQPWIVYGLLKTRDAYSITVSASEVLFSIILFGTIYLFLGALYIFLVAREVQRGPEPINGEASRP